MILTLFHSFWGQFGWMGIPYADRTYDVIAAGSSMVVVGMILFGWRVVVSPLPAQGALREGIGGEAEIGRPLTLSLSRGERETQELPTVLLPWQRWALGLLVAEFVLVVVGVVFYNLEYLQPQGRYLFPTLPALAIFAAAGVAEIIRPRYAALVFALTGLALTWLAVYSLVDVIGPAFAS
jgi:hypothetical protein